MTEPTRTDRLSAGAGPLAPGLAHDRTLSVTLLALWSIAVIALRWGDWAEDLSALYIAGWLWQNGEPGLIYAAPPGFFGGVAESWQPAMERLGIGERVSFPYVYPPLWAALIAPLTTVVSPQGFADAATLVQVPLLAGSVHLAGRLLKPAHWSVTVWTLTGLAMLTLSIQSYHAIWHNQPTITVTFLVLLAFHCLGSGRPCAAGTALALAVAIKVTPAAFALIFLVDRQYRALAAFAVVGAALGLFSLALAGLPAHLEFLQAVREVKANVLLVAVNTSVLPALLTLAMALGLTEPIPTHLPTFVIRDFPGWIAPLLTLTAAAIVAAFLHRLRPWQQRIRLGFGLLAMAIILPLFGPLGWQHYYLMPMLLLPGLAGLVPMRRTAAVLGVVWLPSLWGVFGHIHLLPWPAANYVWLSCLAWLTVLAALYRIVRQKPAEL